MIITRRSTIIKGSTDGVEIEMATTKMAAVSPYALRFRMLRPADVFRIDRWGEDREGKDREGLFADGYNPEGFGKYKECLFVLHVQCLFSRSQWTQS